MCLIASDFTGKSKQVWRLAHTNIKSTEKQLKVHISVLARTKEFQLTSLKGEIYWLFISNNWTIYLGRHWSRTCFPNNNVICKKCTHPCIIRTFALTSSVYNLRKKTKRVLAESFLGLKSVKPGPRQSIYPWQCFVKQPNFAVSTSPAYLPSLPPGMFLGVTYCSKEVHHQNYTTTTNTASLQSLMWLSVFVQERFTFLP